jgi:hypothetical protein
MKLKALDQVHVSAVQADSLRPGQEFEVGDELGETLLKRHPARFERLEDASAEAPSKPAVPKEKKPPRNKAAPNPQNKGA